MTVRDAAGIAYAVIAVVFTWIAILSWQRRRHSPTVAVSLAVVMLALGFSAAADAVAVTATSERVAAIASLAIVPGIGLATGALLCLGLGIARPQWVPPRALVRALTVEPLLLAVAVATNPLHLGVYRGTGAAELTGSATWGYGPVFWVHTGYCYLLLALGLGAIVQAWRRAPGAFRRQRRTLVLAILIPSAANLTYLARGFGDMVDPTPFGFAVAGALLAHALFREELFTLSPVARALIVDQIGDVIVVLDPTGRILDLNVAATELVRCGHPDAPADLVGSPAGDLFGRILDAEPDRASTTVETHGRLTEFEVRRSPLLDLRGRSLGEVFVARDVTETNAQSRRLAEANTRLVHQIETIDRLRSDLAEQAGRDPLTGLHNRRHMVERFPLMVAESARAGAPLAVVLLDVDLFKEINDQHGHLVGDQVLVALAHRLRTHAPAQSLLARWGGEEFFIALPGTDAAGGLVVADDLRRRCAGFPIAVADHTIHCTLSGGVAAFPTSGTTTNELFHAADMALYTAKADGRNRVHAHAGAHADATPSEG
ncbi:histidine kinase N-terminal 7TM domain-containing diguanylate cyclase [Cellulomonas hominis]